MADDNEHVTIREFEGFKDAVVNAISDSSSGVHKRLDSLDRRFDNVQHTTNQLLRISGEHATKLGEHERRLNANGHKHFRKDDPPPSPDNEPLTMKDLKRAVYVAAAVLGIAAATAAAFIASVWEKQP